MIDPVKSIPSPPETPILHSDRTQITAFTPEHSGDSPHRQRDPKPPVETTKTAGADPVEVEPDFRLVIEHNVERSVLVYKLINRTTGEVMSEISRDDVVKLITDPSYRAGAVVDTRA